MLCTAYKYQTQVLSTAVTEDVPAVAEMWIAQHCTRVILDIERCKYSSISATLILGVESADRCADVMHDFRDKLPDGYEGWVKK